jgi:hypothetical protein
MAFFPSSEIPTDEPFKQYLTPLEVAADVQSALSALWLASSEEQRSPTALEQSAGRLFNAVEDWWMNLTDRTGVAIVVAAKEAFGMPPSALEEAKAGTLKMETLASWQPAHSFAEALFSAWLLQPEGDRTPQGTVQIVRRILDRQIRCAAEDVAIFAATRQR